MSGLIALDKLRIVARMAKGRNLENHEECNKLLVIADEIDGEIAERFMERPVDAGGVPIRMGDAVEGELLDGTTVMGTVCAFHLYDDEPDSVFVHVDVDADGGWTIKDLRLTRCRHVNPRTVEDVLRDCCTEWNEHLGSDWETGVYAKYAAEIRELMANDKLASESGVSAHGEHSNDGEAAL